LDIKRAMLAPASTRRGIADNMTRANNHPLINATAKPPMNVAISCRNFPTCKKAVLFHMRIAYKVL
jgi:hypothetical protein